MPREARFWKNWINHLITSVQAIGHKTPNLETYFSNFSKIRQQKNDEFWKKLIIGNLVCIKTCYSFEPAKTLSMTKNTSPKTVIPWNHLWLMPWGTLTKNCPFFGNTFEPHLSLNRSDTSNLKPKAKPFLNKSSNEKRCFNLEGHLWYASLLWVDKS